MKKMISAAALSAILAVSMAPAVSAMGNELNMLTGAVYTELKLRGVDTDNIDGLTLSQLAAIKSVLDSDDSQGQMTQQIKSIVESPNTIGK